MKSFVIGGKQITVHHFAPELPAGTRAPAIIVVHGSGGGRRFEAYGREFTRLGYHVFVVHYFERTGHAYVYPQIVEKHFLEWMETLAEAITFAINEPGVDATRIALLGISLGGYLALALASQDQRVAAVIEIFGGMPKQIAPLVKRMPPVLILHGDADDIVPVSEAYELESLLQKIGSRYEMLILPGAGHGFSGVHQAEAAEAISDFLGRYVEQAAA